MENSKPNKFDLKEKVYWNKNTAVIEGLWVNDDGSVSYEIRVTSRNAYKGWRSPVAEKYLTKR